MEHFNGVIPLLYKKGDKRPDIINQNQKCLNILCPKHEENVLIFLDYMHSLVRAFAGRLNIQ